MKGVDKADYDTYHIIKFFAKKKNDKNVAMLLFKLCFFQCFQVYITLDRQKISYKKFLPQRCNSMDT